jgi:hypothetical protein
MEERLNRRNWAGLSPCRKSAGFTIDTNAEPPKLTTSDDLRPAGGTQQAWGCTQGRRLPTELRDLGLLTRYPLAHCRLFYFPQRLSLIRTEFLVMTTDQPASFLAEFKNLAWPKTQAIPQSLRNRDLAFLRVLLTVKRCLEHRVPISRYIRTLISVRVPRRAECRLRESYQSWHC